MKRLIVYFSILTFHFSLLKAQNGIIITVAGNGDRTTGAFSGDGGPATSAELGTLGGIAFDAAGNYYIVDMGNNRVRMVSKVSGIINTVVGGGSNGNDNIPATDAVLNLPQGIFIDKSGSIYIADDLDNAIRKVDASTGIITTVAGILGSLNKGYSGNGGQATAALLDEPTSLALDDTGNIYIADFHNNVIRKVTASTGIITTIAGNGYGYWNGPGSWTGLYGGDGGPATSAYLYGPDAIAIDDSGNIFIADDENNAIRKVSVSTGIITTVAGNGVGGYIGDSGAATDAEIWSPTGVTLDSSGNIYIGDNENNVIRKVTISTGIITTIIGNGVSNYTGDGGPASAAELRYPYGVTFDAFGNIFVSDADNYVVRKVIYNSTGINEIKQTNEVSVYPNPTNGNITFQFNTPLQGNIEIYDITGQKIEQTQVSAETLEINLENQPNGVYFYRVLSEGTPLGKEDGSLVGEGKIVLEN